MDRAGCRRLPTPAHGYPRRGFFGPPLRVLSFFACARGPRPRGPVGRTRRPHACKASAECYIYAMEGLMDWAGCSRRPTATHGVVFSGPPIEFYPFWLARGGRGHGGQWVEREGRTHVKRPRSAIYTRWMARWTGPAANGGPRLPTALLFRAPPEVHPGPRCRGPLAQAKKGKSRWGGPQKPRRGQP